MQDNNTPIDPAAASLMAGIVAKSLKNYNANHPQANLASESCIRDISESVAVDMMTAIAQLAAQVTSVGNAPTRPQAAATRRGIDAYKKNNRRPARNDFLHSLGKDDEEQYPETD